jgi:DNA-directed RNA polymerase sigma subunit (sigma70/sigma32)
VAAPAAPHATPEYLDAVLARYERYARYRAHTFRLPYIPIEDREQGMRLALWLAARRFRGDALEQGASYRGYANYYLNTELRRLTSDSFPDQPVPQGVARAVAELFRLKGKHVLPEGTEEARAALGKHAHFGEGPLRAILAVASRASTRRLDDSPRGQDDDGLTYHALLGETEEGYARAEGRVEMELVLAEARRVLRPRYYRALVLRFGLDDPVAYPYGRTFGVVAAMLGVSKQRVQQMETKALAQLRRAFSRAKEPNPRRT